MSGFFLNFLLQSNIFICYTYLCVCTSVGCACASAHVRQRTMCRSCSLLPPCGFWRFISAHQARQQAPSLSKLSCWPQLLRERLAEGRAHGSAQAAWAVIPREPTSSDGLTVYATMLGFYMCLWGGTQVLLLGKQASCPLSHFHSPHFKFENQAEPTFRVKAEGPTSHLHLQHQLLGRMGLWFCHGQDLECPPRDPCIQGSVPSMALVGSDVTFQRQS